MPTEQCYRDRRIILNVSALWLLASCGIVFEQLGDCLFNVVNSTEHPAFHLGAGILWRTQEILVAAAMLWAVWAAPGLRSAAMLVAAAFLGVFARYASNYSSYNAQEIAVYSIEFLSTSAIAVVLVQALGAVRSFRLDRMDATAEPIADRRSWSLLTVFGTTAIAALSAANIRWEGLISEAEGWDFSFASSAARYLLTASSVATTVIGVAFAGTRSSLGKGIVIGAFFATAVVLQQLLLDVVTGLSASLRDTWPYIAAEAVYSMTGLGFVVGGWRWAGYRLV